MLSVLTIEAKITDKLVVSGGKFDKALVDNIVRSLSECMLAENEPIRPAAPPATQPGARGVLRGRAVHKGQPVAGVQINVYPPQEPAAARQGGD